mgnify:CR=1 FL=1
MRGHYGMTERSTSRRSKLRAITGYLKPEEEEFWEELKVLYGVTTDADVVRKLLQDKQRYLRTGEAKLDQILEVTQETSTKLDTALLLIAKK